MGTKSIAEFKSAGLDTRRLLTYNERAHKQNIIYGCATTIIYLFSIALALLKYYNHSKDEEIGKHDF